MADSVTKIGLILSATDKMSKVVDSAVGKSKSKLNSFAKDALTLGGVLSTGMLTATAFEGVKAWDESIQSLSAVTGVSGAALDEMKSQIQSLAKVSGKTSVDVAKSFEVVGSAMSQYLDNPDALNKISKAGILLSKASKMELEPSLRSLTSAMNQFNMSADEASKVVNVLTAGEIVGQVSTAKSVEALSKFGAVANSMNTTLPESIALIQVLGKKLPTEELGTASRNLLLVMDSSKGMSKEAQESFARNGVSLDVLTDKTLTTAQRLTELSKVQGDSVAMSKIFGKENITAAKVIFDQLDTYKDWTAQIEKTQQAEAQAAKNSASFTMIIDKLKNSFVNYAIGINESSGTLGFLGKMLNFVANNMNFLMTTLGIGIGIFAAYKTVIYSTIAVQKILTAATWASKFATDFLMLSQKQQGAQMLASGAAAKAYNVIQIVGNALTYGWAAAMGVLNVAMKSVGIGWIIAAIGLLIGAVIMLIANWDKVTAAMKSVWNGIKTAWEGIKSVFMTGVDFISNIFSNLWDGILYGLEFIGKSILTIILQPIKLVLSLLSKLPLIGEAFGKGVELINNITTTNNPLETKTRQEKKDEQIMRSSVNYGKGETLKSSVVSQVYEKKPAEKIQNLAETISKSTSSINYSPNITIQGNATETDKMDFQKLLSEHKKEIVSLVDQNAQNKKRLSY